MIKMLKIWLLTLLLTAIQGVYSEPCLAANLTKADVKNIPGFFVRRQLIGLPSEVLEPLPPSFETLIKIDWKSFDFDRSKLLASTFAEAQGHSSFHPLASSIKNIGPAGDYYFVGQGVYSLYTIAKSLAPENAKSRIRYLPVSRRLLQNESEEFKLKLEVYFENIGLFERGRAFIIDNVSGGSHTDHSLHELTRRIRNFREKKGESKTAAKLNVVPFAIDESERSVTSPHTKTLKQWIDRSHETNEVILWDSGRGGSKVFGLTYGAPRWNGGAVYDDFNKYETFDSKGEPTFSQNLVQNYIDNPSSANKAKFLETIRARLNYISYFGELKEHAVAEASKENSEFSALKTVLKKLDTASTRGPCQRLSYD